MALLDNSTEIVTSTQSGTGWSVDVTDCNLSSDVGQKDFLVYFNDVVQSNTVFTKTSSTTVTYTGSSIPSTSVTVVRDTPTIRIQEVIYGDRFTSSLWENEMNRIHRILFDLDVQKSNQIATDFSGIVTVETPSLLDDSQRVANTEWVRDILADFAQSSDVTVLNARFISNLLLLAKPDTGTRTIVILEGYSVNGDGGGGAFYWDEADTSTTVDNGTVFTVAGSSSNGRWKRIRPSDRHWNVRWFGAKGDNTTDDYSAMQACINASTDDSDVYIPSGQYRISQSLTFDHSRWTLRGDGGGSVIKAGSGMASGDALIDSQCSNRTTYTGSMTAVHIRDLGFDGANQNTVGILLSGFSQGCKIERVVMRQLYGGIYINGSWGWTISNSWIRGANASTGNGLWLGDSLNGASDNGGSLACNGFNVTGTYIYNWVGTGCYGIILDNGGVRNIKDSVIEYNEKSIWIKNGNVTNISGCYFEGNDTTTNIEIGTDGSSTKPSHINITNNLLNQDGVRFFGGDYVNIRNNEWRTCILFTTSNNQAASANSRFNYIETTALADWNSISTAKTHFDGTGNVFAVAGEIHYSSSEQYNSGDNLNISTVRSLTTNTHDTTSSVYSSKGVTMSNTSNATAGGTITFNFVDSASAAQTATIGFTNAGNDFCRINGLIRAGVDWRPVNGTINLGANSATNTWLNVYGINAYTATSDERLKTNFVAIADGLNVLNRLQPMQFNWLSFVSNEEGTTQKPDEEIHYGLVAQQVEKVLPAIVGTDEDGYKTLRYQELIAFLISAVQQLETRLKLVEELVRQNVL